LVSYGQLESLWPVHGSVLIDDETPTVYFAAGRSSHLDGGIRIYALEPTTGKVLNQKTVAMNTDGEDVIQQRGAAASSYETSASRRT
jgi:hypothetical protein